MSAACPLKKFWFLFSYTPKKLYKKLSFTGTSSLFSFILFVFDIYFTFNFPPPFVPYPAPILIEFEELKILANIAAKGLFLFMKFCPINPNATTTSIKRD